MSITDADALAVVCTGVLSDNAATIRQQLIEAGLRRDDERVRHQAELAAIWRRVCEVARGLATSGGAPEDVDAALDLMEGDIYRLILYGDARVGKEVVVVREEYCEYENFAPRVVDDTRMLGRIVKVVRQLPRVHYICVRVKNLEVDLTLEFNLAALEPRARNMR